MQPQWKPQLNATATGDRRNESELAYIKEAMIRTSIWNIHYAPMIYQNRKRAKLSKSMHQLGEPIQNGSDNIWSPV